jgi:hypothetical protein
MFLRARIQARRNRRADALPVKVKGRPRSAGSPLQPMKTEIATFLTTIVETPESAYGDRSVAR